MAASSSPGGGKDIYDDDDHDDYDDDNCDNDDDDHIDEDSDEKDQRWPQSIFTQVVAVISTACFCLVEKRLKQESEDFQAEPPGRQKPENPNNEVLEDHLQPELQRLKNLESLE